MTDFAAIQPLSEVTTAANVCAKLPCWGDVDPEALLSAFREKLADKGAVTTVTLAQLKALFLSLGYDKVLNPVEEEAEEEEAPAEEEAEEEDAEGEELDEAALAEKAAAKEAAAAAAAEARTAARAAKAAARAALPPPEASKNADAVWDAVCGAGAAARESLDAAWLCSTLQLYKGGYGEAALSFAVKAGDHAAVGAVSEAALWRALTRVASKPLSPIVRNHLRKAFRTAERYVEPEPEPVEEVEAEGEEGAEEGEAAAEGGEEEGTEPPATEEGAAAAAPEEAAADAPAEGEGADASAVAPNAEEAAPVVALPPPPKVPEVLVLIESVMSLLAEDEVLAGILSKDVEVPIEEPAAEEEAAEEEE